MEALMTSLFHFIKEKTYIFKLYILFIC